jgi:hypothetical protein
MFHELLEVDDTVAVDVGEHGYGDDLLLGEIDVGALGEAQGVL